MCHVGAQSHAYALALDSWDDLGSHWTSKTSVCVSWCSVSWIGLWFTRYLLQAALVRFYVIGNGKAGGSAQHSTSESSSSTGKAQGGAGNSSKVRLSVPSMSWKTLSFSYCIICWRPWALEASSWGQELAPRRISMGAPCRADTNWVELKMELARRQVFRGRSIVVGATRTTTSSRSPQRSLAGLLAIHSSHEQHSLTTSALHNDACASHCWRSIALGVSSCR